MILSKEDKEKFCKYLEENIGSNLGLINQLMKINPRLASIYRDKTKVYQTVLSDIVAMETQTIGN